MTTYPCLAWTWFPDELTAAEEFLADHTDYVFPAHGILVRPF